MNGLTDTIARECKMRFTYAEIKKDLLDNWETITDSTWPEDYLDEFADGYIPVYTNEIIKDWQEMPSEFDNFWQDYGITKDTTIPDLMKIDLFNYYRNLAQTAYNEILTELEDEEWTQNQTQN